MKLTIENKHGLRIYETTDIEIVKSIFVLLAANYTTSNERDWKALLEAPKLTVLEGEG